MRMIWCAVASFAALACPAPAHADSAPPPAQAAIEQYVRPYVDTRNFSGVILAAREGRPIFAEAYGFADFARGVPNTLETRFHIASMSMQYTAAAILRLAMRGELSLDTTVSRFVPDFPNGDEITIRHLLTQTSGIRDINGLPDYETVLQSHQTPLTLVEKIRNLPPDRRPGTYEREEHSAFNLLALIIERQTGLSFAEAVRRLVFDPLNMESSGIDDDNPGARDGAALGHAPVGTQGVAPAELIHWSAKAGNGSAYTTAGDQLRFIEGLFDPNFLSPALRDTMFDLSNRVGYGWFKSNSARFGQPVFSMNGRAPGFSSAEIYVPGARLFVVALSNIYASFTPDIVNDVAASLLDLPYEPLRLQTAPEAASLAGLPASFRFDQDFYQPHAVVRVAAEGGEVFLIWPTGDRSPLIPTSTDHYVDRSYGVAVEVVRDTSGTPTSLKYDRFVGQRFADGGNSPSASQAAD